MQELVFAMKKVWDRNKDGSHNTQQNRWEILKLCAGQWRDLGFKDFKEPQQLAGRHVQALVTLWQQQELSEGTVKNRMAVLRWLAEKVGRASVVLSNEAYGIDRRVYSTNEQTAKALDREKWERITNPYVRASLELIEHFKLRREESIKFRPSYADQGDHIRLKASWCKGGRYRELPVEMAAQRELLDRLHKLAGKGSLIPADKSYIQQRRVYDRWVQKVGIENPHGIRHYGAQQRYLELTGWPCPKAGGKTSRELTWQERLVDNQARLTISQELGHAREQVTVIYLGR